MLRKSNIPLQLPSYSGIHFFLYTHRHSLTVNRIYITMCKPIIKKTPHHVILLLWFDRIKERVFKAKSNINKKKILLFLTCWRNQITRKCLCIKEEEMRIRAKTTTTTTKITDEVESLTTCRLNVFYFVSVFSLFFFVSIFKMFRL